MKNDSKKHNEADEINHEDLSAAALFFDELRRKELSKAMFLEYGPSNPIPFLNGLKQGCKDEGSDYIQTDEAKRILFTLLQQAYGSAFKIDSFEEFMRLKMSFKE